MVTPRGKGEGRRGREVPDRSDTGRSKGAVGSLASGVGVRRRTVGDDTQKRLSPGASKSSQVEVEVLIKDY